jgi:murein DD-endopeptidase MepM/ murein hydrolase activator NlpD
LAEAPEAPDVTAEAPTRGSSSSALSLPVAGNIIRTYDKGKNEGIDIAAAPGTSVTAAEAGTVAAITADADQVPIIVVKHNNDLLTVYANVEDITVKKGDRVRRGQKLAELRGGDNAYVHFEVRKGFESVDPEPYLR